MTAVDAGHLDARVIEGERCQRFLSVAVPADLVAAKRRAASKELAGRIRLDGFRDGKAPTGIVDRRFGDVVLENALNELVKTSAQAVIESRGLRPISSVKIDTVEFADGGGLTFKASFEVAPEVKIRRVGGFVVPPPTGMPPLDGAIERRMDDLRHARGMWRPVESDGDKPQLGDRVKVVLEHVGVDEGEGGEGGTAYDFLLGADHALPGIQDAVRTLSVGQEGEFDVDFPGTEEGAPGETKRLRIRLEERFVSEVPELNDDFARTVGGFETLDDLRAAIRGEMEKMHHGEVEEHRDAQLVRMLVDANDFDVPASVVDKFADAMLDDLVAASTREKGEEVELSTEERDVLRERLMDHAEFTAKRELILDRLAEDHGLHASEEDVDNKVEEIAERMERSPAEVYSMLQAGGNIDKLQQQLTGENIRTFLRQQSGLQ